MAICLDIETLSKQTNAVILQVGVKEFFPDDLSSVTLKEGRTLRSNLSAGLQMHIGRHFDYETHSWWNNTHERAKLYQEMRAKGDQWGSTPLSDQVYKLREELEKFFIDDRDTEVWARGPQFDCVIVEDLLSEFGLQVPWKYNKVCDSRTFLKAAKIATGKDFQSKWDDFVHGVQHDGLNDARKEAMDIVQAHKALRFIGSEPV